MHKDRLLITDLEIRAVIGVHDWERLSPQRLLLELELQCDLSRAGASDKIEDTVDYYALCDRVVASVSSSRFTLLEALAERVAGVCLDSHPNVIAATVKLSKPGALPGFGRALASVQITRHALHSDHKDV